jgi:transposase
MKKEARTKAATLFLQSGGKATNKEIADKVGVNPLTVGRWKKQDNWAAKLEEPKPKPKPKAPAAKIEQPKPKASAVKRPTAVRKKAKQEEALKLYLKAGGKITNNALATKIGVSPVTISNWKNAGGWSAQAKKTPVSVPEAIESVEEKILLSLFQETQTVEEIEIDIEALTVPDHITVLNKRMDEMLAREYLSPEDLKTAAEAKEAFLKAVSAYIDVLEKVSED